MAAPGLLIAAMLPHRRTPRATRGYSLIEVLTAMSVSGILLAIAAPSFNGLRGPYTLRQTTQQIAAEFSKARMRAIARNQRYRFTYNANTKTYALERETAANSWQTESTGQLPSAVSITTGGTPPIFDTRGMLNQTMTTTVSVEGHPTTRTVTINVLGKVTIS